MANPAPPDKAQLRAHLRDARRSRSEAQRSADAHRLADVVTSSPLLGGALVVAAYASTSTEPGTGPLRAALASRGVRVLLPVVTESGVLAWRWDEPPGGSSPPGTGEEPLLRLADVVLLPALAVDARGHRLGQGGGHYDRTLAALQDAPGRSRLEPLPLLVALLNDDEVLNAGAVPAEPHDVRVGAVATSTHWRTLG